MNRQDLKDYLDEKVDKYNHPTFIESDPILIPHQFTTKEDIEISAFLTALISWGNRKSIIKSATKMLELMGNTPYDFVLNASENDLNSILSQSIHRTFKGEDFVHFIYNLRTLFTTYNSIEDSMSLQKGETNYYHALYRFRTNFLADKTHRSTKHISSTYKNSSAKRLMMFLRWMVRQDNRGVDFGLWNNHSPKFLSIPLDIHSGRVSRQLGLLSRKKNDWKAVAELDHNIRILDSNDPAKYDYALFGIGLNKEI